MADEKSESAAEGFYELNGVMAKDVAGIPMTVDEIAKAYAEGLKDGSMPYMSRPPKPAGEKELAGYFGLSAQADATKAGSRPSGRTAGSTGRRRIRRRRRTPTSSLSTISRRR
jgi:hypothetical protein